MTDAALLTVDQVAEILGMSTKFVRQRAHAGEIRYARLGDRMRFRPEDVDDYVASRLEQS